MTSQNNTIILLVLFLIIACKKENAVSTIKTIYSVDTVSFKNTIVPLLINNCSNSDCHPDIAVYDNLMLYPRPLVVPNDIANSGLYQSVLSKRMPLNIKKLSDNEVKLIATWILAGAKNN